MCQVVSTVLGEGLKRWPPDEEVLSASDSRDDNLLSKEREIVPQVGEGEEEGGVPARLLVGLLTE